jgi:peptidoglycan/LPS O-acetylase OafA/YrhL
MQTVPAAGRKKGGRNHTFDLLRIVFALLVILSHAPELTDGNRSREIFTRLLHTPVSFGVVAVDGFFLLSGFLIVRSWEGDPRLGDFLRKRVLRIVPGYAVAVAISVLSLLSIYPAHAIVHAMNPRFWYSVVTLGAPDMGALTFPGMAVRMGINGSLWTICYEFRCYLLVALFGGLLFVRRRAIWAAATLTLGLLTIPAIGSHVVWKHLIDIIGAPANDFRLSAIFFLGGTFYLFRDIIPFRWPLGLFALAALALNDLLLPQQFEAGLVLFGGYLLFFLGSRPAASLDWMRRLPDVSYGIYLYGWLVEAIWISFVKGSPWVTFASSSAICLVLGWLSWHLVERPMLTLKPHPTAPLPHG